MAINPYDTPRGKFRTRAETTRRQFLGIMGGIGGLGALVFGGFMSLKFMFPEATLEDPPKFKAPFDAGAIAAMPIGVQQITNKRIALVRDDGGFYAVYLICTHLGCTPNYAGDVAGDLSSALTAVAEGRGERNPDQRIPDGWKCPCHGSRYYIDSTNFYGPAPRPMDWVAVSKAPDGGLVIDRAQLVVMRQAGDTTAPTWRLDYESGQVKGETVGV